jgi:hypothetical protein
MKFTRVAGPLGISRVTELREGITGVRELKYPPWGSTLMGVFVCTTGGYW